MKNLLMLLLGTVAAEGTLWVFVPGLATVVGVVLGLFAIASWRERASMKHSVVYNGSNVEDFQRNLDATAQ